MDDSKFWNLDEGLTVGYSLVPHTLVALLLNSETLTKSEINVLTCLFRQTAGCLGRPDVTASAEQIASMTKLHPKSVEQALRALERKGHITIEREKGGPSRYRLTFEQIRPPKQERKRSRRAKAASPPLPDKAEEQRQVEEARRRRTREMLGLE